MSTLAVFGGSFDPPHLAHTLVTAYVLSATDITELLVIPTAQHPFGKALTPFHHRLRMAELNFAALHGVQVSDLEAQLGGVSRTLRTLQTLAQQRPQVELRLIMGTDLLSTFDKWHGADEITQLAPPLVVQRAGYVTDPTAPVLPQISSTEIRRRLANGTSTAGLLNPAVARYIADHRLYRNEDTPPGT